MDRLANLNAHPKDAFITFDEPSHKYFLKGDKRNVTSVTTFMKRFFHEFDGSAIIRVHGSRWRSTPGHKYEHKSDQAILDEWENNRVLQSSLGTRMHERFELFYNEENVTRTAHILQDDSADGAEVPEYSQFNRFHETHDINAYRTEMRVYDSVLRLAGSIDLIAQNTGSEETAKETRYTIYDWKRSSKELSPDAPHYGRMCKAPLSHLPDTAYTHYVLQQNMYAHLLLEQYNMVATDMYLVRFHPTIDDYQLIKVPRWDKEVRLIMKARSINLQNIRKFRGVYLTASILLSVYRKVRRVNCLKRCREDLVHDVNSDHLAP
eukprot:gene133-200_t